jgi:ABC-type sulfate/molybdate transport systems ATPase subunit
MQISTIINKHSRKISGGEAQRVVLARAMVMETPIILLDEPTNSLDDTYRPLLVELLCKTGQNLKTTVVIASHDTNFISSLSGRILRMEKGTILNSADI